MCVRVCARASLYFIEYQNTHSTFKVRNLDWIRIFVKWVLVGLHKFKELLEAYEVVLRLRSEVCYQ